MTRRPPIAPRGRAGANAPAAPARRRHASGVPAPGAIAPGAGTPDGTMRPTERGAAGLQARRAALEILVRVESHAAFADVMLGHRLAAFALPDRRLLTRLVLGTLAWRGRLDYELAQLCTQPLEKLERPVLGALRLGLFQMRHLSRVPAHAAVDTAVSLAREAAGRGAGGLVNAVLRRAARDVAAMPERAADENRASRGCILASAMVGGVLHRMVRPRSGGGADGGQQRGSAERDAAQPGARAARRDRRANDRRRTRNTLRRASTRDGLVGERARLRLRFLPRRTVPSAIRGFATGRPHVGPVCRRDRDRLRRGAGRQDDSSCGTARCARSRRGARSQLAWA